MIARLRQWARALKRDVLVLWLAARDNRITAAIKLLAAFVAGYALSPIDLIPDFIPVLGYLDDLILLPLGFALAIRLIPTAVLAECRAAAREVFLHGQPISRTAGIVVVMIWLLGSFLLSVWAYGAFV